MTYDPRFSKTVDTAAKAAGITYEQAEVVLEVVRVGLREKVAKAIGDSWPGIEPHEPVLSRMADHVIDAALAKEPDPT